MLGRLSRHSIAAIAALAFAAGGIPPVLASQPALTSAAPRQVKNGKRGLFGGVRMSTGYGRKGAGVSMAAQKRAARKSRNVARNRRSHR
jgi:hypothetical protein